MTDFKQQFIEFQKDLSSIGIKNTSNKMINYYRLMLIFTLYSREIATKDTKIFKILPIYPFNAINLKYNENINNMETIWKWLQILTQLAFDYSNKNDLLIETDNAIMINSKF
jgi:hypothetical protein